MKSNISTLQITLTVFVVVTFVLKAGGGEANRYNEARHKLRIEHKSQIVELNEGYYTSTIVLKGIKNVQAKYAFYENQSEHNTLHKLDADNDNLYKVLEHADWLGYPDKIVTQFEISRLNIELDKAIAKLLPREVITSAELYYTPLKNPSQRDVKIMLAGDAQKQYFQTTTIGSNYHLMEATRDSIFKNILPFYTFNIELSEVEKLDKICHDMDMQVKLDYIITMAEYKGFMQGFRKGKFSQQKTDPYILSNYRTEIANFSTLKELADVFYTSKPKLFKEKDVLFSEKIDPLLVLLATIDKNEDYYISDMEIFKIEQKLAKAKR